MGQTLVAQKKVPIREIFCTKSQTHTHTSEKRQGLNKPYSPSGIFKFLSKPLAELVKFGSILLACAKELDTVGRKIRTESEH